MNKFTWEYLVTEDTERLYEYGDQGWELVAVVVVDGQEKLYFKKPALSLREQLTLDQRSAVLQRSHKEGENE